jgi:hypothetical protein
MESRQTMTPDSFSNDEQAAAQQVTPESGPHSDAEFDLATEFVARTGDYSLFEEEYPTADHDDEMDDYDDDDQDDDDSPALDPRGGRYRERLREAEAERDTLTELVMDMQATEAERLAAQYLADPEDLWREQDLADVLDAGRVDPEMVRAACQDVVSRHKHWAAPLDRYHGPLRSGATSIKVERPSKTLTDAFSPQPQVE